MKPILKYFAFGLMLMPFALSAQTHVKEAFNNVVEVIEGQVTVNQKHSLEKDPVTCAKVSQYDIYNFTIPKDQIWQIRKIEKAFQQDAESAYSLSSGVRAFNDQPIALAVGEGDGTGLLIAERAGSNYIFALFLAPEDPEGNHRYAYAMDWIEDGKDLIVNLAVTYSTTLKYRQQMINDFFYNPDFGLQFNEAIYSDNQGAININYGPFMPEPVLASWISQLITNATAMTASQDIAARRVLASRVYDLAKNFSNYDDASSDDKATAIEIIKSLIDENSDDDVIKSILNGCLKQLK